MWEFLHEKLAILNKSNMKKDIISKEIAIISALKLMDEIRQKLLFVVESDNKFVGVLSLGDIQRAIIRQVPLDSPIKNIIREIITVADISQSNEQIKSIMLEKRIEAMPVIDEFGNLVRIIYWDELFGENTISVPKNINLPVVIMAGGIGSRLKPLTNVIPKPLIPIREKTIIEEIFDSFSRFGCNNFWVSINYRSEIIKYYLENHIEKGNHIIKYMVENIPLGTAGSLRLVENEIKN